MSFLKNSECFIDNCQQRINKSSLQMHSQKGSAKSRTLNGLFTKRMSSFLFSAREGSMTVEASIAIPIFLFAILNLLSIILLFGEFSSNLADMHQRAKELSVHVHILEEGQEVNNDLIILTKAQKLTSILPFMEFQPARTIVNCRVRKWTGYDVLEVQNGNATEEWVYITQTGEAYHRNRSCSYLNPTIHSAVSDKIGELRNKDGEKYYLCLVCAEHAASGICFYTEYGNRYHTTLQCSSLKRNIESVKLSEVGGRHACSKCGN